MTHNQTEDIKKMTHNQTKDIKIMTHNPIEDIEIMTHNQTEDIKKIFHNQTEIEKTGLILKIPLTDNQTHQGAEKLKKPPAVPTTHLD